MNKIIDKFESIIKDNKIRKKDLTDFDKWFKQEFGDDFDVFAEKNNLFKVL